jgi:hypothetical protein
MPNGTPFFCTASGTLLKNGLADWEQLRVRRKPRVTVPAYNVDPEKARKAGVLPRPPTR